MVGCDGNAAPSMHGRRIGPKIGQSGSDGVTSAGYPSGCVVWKTHAGELCGLRRMRVSDDEVVVERRGCVQWVVFNRPKRRNALTWSMYDTLEKVCAGVGSDPMVRAMVVTGAPEDPPAFAAGTEIAEFLSVRTGDDGVEYEGRVERVMRALEGVRIPTVAAIAGSCTGGGAVIAACCDVRLAAPSARYGFPMARTLGNCLSTANCARLLLLLGMSVTKDLLLSARLLDAAEMLQRGLVREVVASEAELRARTQQVAEELAGLAPLAQVASKEVLRRLGEALAGGVEDRDLVRMCYGSRDFQEGVAAFLAKRLPAWEGK